MTLNLDRARKRAKRRGYRVKQMQNLLSLIDHNGKIVLADATPKKVEEWLLAAHNREALAWLEKGSTP